MDGIPDARETRIKERRRDERLDISGTSESKFVYLIDRD